MDLSTNLDGSPRRTLYPEIEPFETGFHDTGDGHILYWERCGNPNGQPVVFLHGGPGGGVSPSNRRYFDPARYHIILFDQRGAGKSTPHADLTNNTTWHLVADIEALRQKFSIEKWHIFGGSWGATLALAYAQSHPERVSALILRGIFTLRRSELQWYYQHGAHHIFPDQWEIYWNHIPEAERGDMIQAYRKRLTSDDRAVRQAAAKIWTMWEGQTVTLLPPTADIVSKFAEDDFADAFARIENHFFVHAGWMEDGQLIKNAHKMQNIPGITVHGRYDICCPLTTAWELHKNWPSGKLVIVPDAGHSLSDPGITHHLIEATDYFASLS